MEKELDRKIALQLTHSFITVAVKIMFLYGMNDTISKRINKLIKFDNSNE